MTIRDYAIQCIKDEAKALLDLIPKIDRNFDDAVELIYRCHGKVIVTGVGKSGHIGAKIAATLKINEQIKEKIPQMTILMVMTSRTEMDRIMIVVLLLELLYMKQVLMYPLTHGQEIWKHS